MIIAVDFDGTIVEHKYPEIGEELPFATSIVQLSASTVSYLPVAVLKNDIFAAGIVNVPFERGTITYSYTFSPEKPFFFIEQFTQ